MSRSVSPKLSSSHQGEQLTRQGYQILQDKLLSPTTSECHHPRMQAERGLWDNFLWENLQWDKQLVG